MFDLHGRKGQLAFIELLIIIGAVALLGGKQASDFEFTTSIGLKQSMVLKSYYDFEGARIYLENAAKYAAYSALDGAETANCFSALNKEEFDAKLTSNMRQFLGANLSTGEYIVDLPAAYGFQTMVSQNQIEISGSAANIRVSGTGQRERIAILGQVDAAGLECTDLGGKLMCFGENKICSGRVENGKKIADSCWDIVDVPSLMAAGGANIKIAVTCDDYRNFKEAFGR